MALKQVLLCRKIAEKQSELAQLDAEAEELRTRREQLQLRNAEAEAALDEVTEETSEEDVASVEALAEELIEEDDALKADETENESKRKALQEQIDELQGELDELNSRAKAKAEPAKMTSVVVTERKDVYKTMETRRIFGMNYQEREAFFARDDMKAFVDKLRAIALNERDVTGAEVLIPEVLLGVLRENLPTYSKLMKHVNTRNIPGNARLVVSGGASEAVWTEQCAKINPADMELNVAEIDGYKVAAYIPVCNAVLQDAKDPVNVGTEITTGLLQGIGKAVDKAILYGTDVKMPMGILTRLAQTAAPSGTIPNQRPWKNLTGNITTIGGDLTGVELFAALVGALGKASDAYGDGGKFWAMSDQTKASLMASAITFTANGSLVSGIANEMPVVGGTIETIGWMPAGVIIGGYGAGYMMGERAGATVSASEHVHFLDDETVFKGVARYDGEPVIGEAFAAVGLGAAPKASDVTFAPDTVNG